MRLCAFAVLCILAGLVTAHPPQFLIAQTAQAQSTSQEKFARGRHGIVSASTPYATAAGARILEEGGNAADAAAAACFALMVTDPAMTSLRRPHANGDLSRQRHRRRD